MANEIFSVVSGGIGIILYICVLVAVFQMSGATQAAAQSLATIQQMLAAGLQHQGVDTSSLHPPCRRCARKGKVTQLRRNAEDQLQCPECGAVRK